MNATDFSTARDPVAEWCPETLAEAGECLRESARCGSTVEIVGAGTARSWGGSVAAERLLSTRGLDDVVRYQPADMTIQVGAGLAVSRLQEIVGERGQRIALDPGRVAHGATIGGLFATSDQGPSHLAFGGPRDQTIGATLVFADGSLARSGGHVIKNVAGYDLARMASGSLGTLALLAEITLRLYPLPAATGTVMLPAAAADARALAHAVSDAQLDPSAAEWHADRLLVRFEGSSSGVADRLTATQRLLNDGSAALEGAEEAAAWADHASVAAPPPGAEGTTLRGLTRPSQTGDVVEDALSIGAELDIDIAVAAGLLTGRVDVRLAGSPEASLGEFVRRWRGRVEPLGGSVVLRQHDPALHRVVEPWGTPPAAVGLMRKIKTAFDPENRLGPGRFGSWLDETDGATPSLGRKA